MAALHSGETADLGGSLDSDAQTVTALALCQASPVWPSTAMASLGHRHGSPMFGSSLLSPIATLPFCRAVPQEPERQASWISCCCVWLPASQPQGGGGVGGERQPGDFNLWRTVLGLTLLFAFHFQNASILLPLGMQMLKSQLSVLEDTSKNCLFQAHPIPPPPSPFTVQTRTQAGRGSVTHSL